MTLSEETQTLLVLVSLGLSALALFVLAAGASARRARLGSGVLSARGEIGTALKEHAAAIQRLQQTIEQLMAEDTRLADSLKGAVQHVGVVRYDAFDDMGGQLSFSAALLDANGDGFVVSSINGRTDTRVYAKLVRGGGSAHNLSDEELAAIRKAVSPASDAVGAT